MRRKKTELAVEIIENKIMLIRGQKVILDRDLADLYGVETKYLNRQVRRNRERFPKEFMFQINAKEKKELVTFWHRFESLKHSTGKPLAFTEHGALMVASILNSPKAVSISIFVVKAFIKIREILSTHKNIALKLKELEKRIDDSDSQVRVLLEAINEMLVPPEPPKKEFGFRIGEKHYEYKTKRSD